MNKIFKVIWSKSKQCYIVVSEIAKNKTGKKKIVVASILVALAMQSGMIADVMAADPPSAKLADAALAVGTNGVAIGSSAKSQSNQSVAIGYFSNAQAPSASPENPATAVGAGANANGAGTVALGLSANATGANAVALGGGSNGGKNKTEATAVETTAVGFNAKASNSRAAAIGSGAGASGSDSIAMGTSTVADSEKAIAIGANSKGTAIGATALGRDTEASGASATALGALASAKGSTATAVGMQASASGTDSVAVGKTASATNNRALAVGTNAKATGENSVAVGSGAGGSGALGFAGSLNSTAGVVNTIRTINYATTADGDNAVALGFYANAKNSGVAVGQNALAATGGVAIGKGVLEDTGNNLAGGVVMGQDSATLGPYSLAMGFNAFASGSTSMAVGHTVSAQGAYAVAMGRKVSATGTSTAIGHHATATNGGLAIGSQENDASNDRTTASAKGAIAIGKNTKATSEDAVAIGTNAEANRLYSVALGSGSTTATGATNQGSTTINGITYNFAGATGNPNMQVSVGNTGATRQIKNVAAGEVSATSTDAINGSQLYAVASAVKPLKYVSINSTATGTGSNVDNDGAQAPNSIAIGPSSTVTNQNSVALGNNAQSLSDDSIAIGRNAKAESGSVFTNTSRAIAIGSNSRVATNVVQGIAIGSGSLTDEGAVVTGDQSIAIGGNVKVDGHAAIAIGGDDARKAAGQQVSYTNTNDNEVTGTLQTAILNLTGYNLSNYKGTAASHAGVAYGTSALAGNAGVAIGTASDSMTRMNDKGQVVNNKPVTNAVAIGTGARANFDNSVAIGGGSNTDHYATKQVNAVIDGVEVKWSGGENISPGDVVSFGAKGFERQLKNVAPGEVSQTSTDAVNGSQIYSLARKVTNIMNGGSGSVVNVNATGEPLSKVVTGTGASKVEKYYRTVDVKDDGTLVTGAVAQTPTSLALVNVDQTDTNKQTQTPRILGNVANGVKDNDAVNVSQLNAAKVKYFSVNSSDAGNINNDGATGTDAIAIGPSAVSNAVGSVALGKDAKANGAFTVALGGGNWQFKGAQANGVGTTALGSNTKTQENINYQTAIGFGATTSAESALALGYNAAASAQNAIALGKGAFTSGQDSLAFGVNSEAKGGSALAMGPSAQANSNYVVSLGYQANNGATNNANGVSIGWAAGMQSNGSSNVGIGSGAGRQISGNNNVSIGNGAGNLASANLYTSDSIMLGSEARAINGTASKAVSSVIAIGKKASGGADSAIALGQGASSTNQNSIAIGTNSQATAYNGVAIGAYSVANTAGGVAGFNPNTSRTDTYSGLTGRALTSTTGAVAIGSDSQSRQLTGLAAGTQDTDAVNVAQLKSVNLAFKGNAGTGDVNLAAHPLTIQGNDNYITTSANGNTINISGKVQNITVTNGTATAANKGMADAQNVADAINNAVQSNAYKWKLTANGEATPETIAKDDTVDFSGDTNISVARNGKKITTSLKKDITVDSVKVNKSITTGSGSNQITLDGTSGAVTGRTFSGQSFAAGDNVLSNTTLQIGSTTNGNNVTITKDGLTSKAGSTTAKFGATGIDAGGQRITNVSSGGNVGTNAANITDVKNAVSDVTLKLDTNSKTGTVKLSDGSLKIVGANGIRTDLTGTNKDNLVIGLDSNTVNATTKGIGLSGDSGTMLRKFLKDGDADFKISGDGNLVTTVGSAAGVKVSVDSTKVKDLAVEAVTVSKANTVDNPITVTPIASTNSKDYAIGIDTTKLAAKTDLTYRANSAADANAKKISLSKGLNFVDGGSTVATVDNDGKVSFDLNTATKNQISTNTTNIATNTTDIAANKGNITKNTASIATNTAALARNISLGADTGTASSQSLSTADVAFNVKGATGDFISTNMNGNTVEISTTRATINSNATTGEASVTGNDGLATAKNVADAINKAADAAKAGAAWNITTNSSTTDKTAVKGGDTVDLVNGDNIEITQDGTDKKKITVATKKDITVDSVTANNKVTVGSGANKITLDGTDGSVTGKTFTGTTFTGTSFTGTSFTAGNTVINTNGLTNGTTAITGTGVTTDNVTVGGISIDKTTGINAGNNVISNVASGGTTLTNAANIGDVQNAVANLSQNLNITDGTHDGTVDLKNQKLNVAGANGVTATVNNQTITVGLDADTVNATTKGIGLTADTGSTGNKYLKDGDVSFAVTGDGSLVSTSATAAGVKVAVNSATITAGADGTVTGPTTDGVATAKNVADAINAAKKASKTEITANTGEATNATTGNVTLTSTTAADGHTIYDVKLNDKVTLGTGANAVTIDGTTGAITGKTATIGGVTVNGTANTIGGLSNTTWNGTAVSGRAATEDQLKAATGATTLKFTGDVATNTGSVNLKDDTFGIKGDGKYISTDVNGKNVNLTVSEAEVKKSAVAAVTVSTDTTDANNPLTVTPTTSADGTTKDYKVTIDGTKIANKTNLSYKANNGTAKQVSLADGLNFKNGTLTTASIDDAGVVKYDVNTASITAGTDGTITGPTTDGVATAQNVADAINAAKKASKTEITANTGEAANATTGNVTLTSSTAADGHTIYDVKLNDKVTLGTGANVVMIDGTTGAITGKTATIGGVTVNGTANTIGGLSNTTWNGTATTGRAATEDQLKAVADAAGSQTWNITADKAGTTGNQTGTKKNATVGKDETVELVAGDNLTINQNERKFTYSLNKDLANLTSVSVGTGTTETIKLDGATGKITAKNASIGGVTIDGDNNHVTGLSNTTWNGTATAGRAATEDQLKAVADTAKTTTDAVNLQFSGDTNTSPGVVNLKDDTLGIIGDGKYVSTDANGKNLTVKVSEAEVKKSAVAAVTVSTDTTDANNPLTVTPTTSADGTTKDYKVTIDGTKIANKTNLSYKANNGTAKQVSLADGLDFTNGTLTTASIDNNGVVKYDVNTASITAGTDGTITGPTTDGVATAKNVADAINAAKKASKTEITANTGEAANATTGNVSLTSTTAADGHTIYDVKLNDKVTLGTGANAVTIDGTTGAITGKTANIGGVTVNGTANTIGGLSNTTWNGTATTGRAATEDQLKAVADAAGSQTWEITADKKAGTSGVQTGTKENAKVGKDDKVSLIAGENLTVDQSGKNFTYSLNTDLVKMNSATFLGTGTNTTVITGDSITQTAGTQTNTSTAAGNTVADGTKSTETTADGQVIKDGAKSNKSTVDNNVIDDGNGNVNTSNATSNTITDGTNTSTITAGKATIGTSVVDGVNNTFTTGGANAVKLDGAAGTIKTGNVTVTGGTTNDITGLSNTTVTATDFATKGRAATEEQLKAATGATTLKFTGDVATNTGSVNLKDDTFGIKGDGKYISTDVNGKNVTLTVSEAEVKKSAVAAVTVSTDTTDANNPLTVTPTTSADGTTKDYKVTIDGTKIANKTNLSYKANGGTAKQVSLADGLDFTNGTLTTASIDDKGVVKYDVNTASITAATDGTITGPTTDGVATAQNVADAINAAKKASKTEITANTGEAANATTGNVTLTSTTAADGHTIYDVKLNDKVILGTGANAVTIDGTAGKATIGSSIIDGVNKTFTTGGANAVTMDGAAGTIKTGTVTVTGGTTNDITGLSNTTVNSADFATKGRAATEEQLKAVGEQTWQITADKDTTTSGAQTGTKKDAKVGKDDKVQLIAGENMTVNQNERDFTFTLNKDLVKMNSATFLGTGTNTTVITGDSITQTAGTQTNTSTAGGNTVADGTKSTETTADGQVIKDGTKSNKSTVDNNVIDDGTGNVNTSNATSNTITDGTNTSTITAGKATIGTSIVDGVNNTFTTGGTNAVKLDGVAGTIKTGTVTVTGGTTNDITGLSNTTVTAADFATKGRAATEEQLKAVGEQTWQITADKDATTSGTQTGTKKDAKVGKDDKVQLIAGENMTVNQNERDFTFTLNKDLVKMNSATFLGTGTNKTVITGDSIAQTAGTQTNTSTAGGNTVADGTKSTKTTADGQVIKDGAKTNTSTVDENTLVDGAKSNKTTVDSNVIDDGTNTSTITAGKATIGSSIIDGVNNTFTTGGASPVTLNGATGTITGKTANIGGVTVDGTNNHVMGLANKDWTPGVTQAVSGRAATEDQLQKVSDAVGAGWKVNTGKVTGSTGESNGAASTKVASGEEVQFQAGNNLIVDQNGKTVAYSLNKALKDLESATFNGTGTNKTVITGDSITQTAGTQTNTSTAGGNTVADGTKS
ncbi:MAG: ESPR-type extended signal peptide-containing protein, partial [Veillonella sp.]|uniref:ESPR-type extended signal peptide-containing protein n=3 Tax=Veillonella TaxID=29465 RepID=UPI00290ADFB2